MINFNKIQTIINGEQWIYKNTLIIKQNKYHKQLSPYAIYDENDNFIDVCHTKRIAISIINKIKNQKFINQK
jgi:hypothetical protein